MTADQVRDQIREAFPPAAFYGTITSCTCEECRDFDQNLRHKRWDEVPVEYIDFTCSPTLLTPEAFAAFLAACLMRAMDNMTNKSTVCPNPEEEEQRAYRLERVRVMNPDQIQAVRSFLQYVANNAENADWFQDFIQPALATIWK